MFSQQDRTEAVPGAESDRLPDSEIGREESDGAGERIEIERLKELSNLVLSISQNALSSSFDVLTRGTRIAGYSGAGIGSGWNERELYETEGVFSNQKECRWVHSQC